MKVNFFLSLFLGILLIFTYFFEEKKIFTSSTHHSGKVFNILNQQRIERIKLQQSEIERVEDDWIDLEHKWKIDNQKVHKFIEHLKQIEIYNEMAFDPKTKWDDALTLSLFFENEWHEITLLGVSKQTGAMYFKTSEFPESVFIGRFLGSSNDVYVDEIDQKIKKYLFLKKVFNTKNEVFFSSNFLISRDILKPLKVKVHNKRNKWFEVRIDKDQTIPVPYLGIEVKQTLDILNKLTEQIEVKSAIKSGINILSDERSTVILEGQNKKITAHFYLGLNGKYGQFIKFDDDDSIYEVGLPSENIFMSNVQLFWNKKFKYGIDFTKLKKLEFSLQNLKNEKIKFYVDDFETFKVKTSNKNVAFIDTVRMNFLFNLLLNLTEFKEAKFVQMINKKMGKEKGLIIELFKKHFKVMINMNAIYVDDTIKGIRYVFENKTQEIQKGFFDKIFTVKNK